MGVGLSGSGAGGGKAMANEGVNVEAVGNILEYVANQII